jgi:tetratricopeptide (TPR) repeat protein
VLVCTLATLACTSKEVRVEQHRTRAQEYFEKEQWSEAKIELLNLLQLAPSDAQAQFQMAETLVKLNEYGDALWRYSEAVRLSPDNLEWRLKLAQLELAAQRFEPARENVDAILAAQPENVEALLLRGALKSLASDMDGLLADVDAALAIDPNHQDALKMKARVLGQRGDHTGAEQILRRIIEIDPSSDNHLVLALLLAGQKRSDEALAEYRAAIEVGKTPAERTRARVLLANFHLSHRNDAEAEASLLEAREEVPEDSALLLTLAQFYQTRGKTDQAREMLEENARQQPSLAQPLLVLADFERRLGHRDAALAVADRALQAEPKSEAARLLRAELLMEGSREDPARRDQAQAIVAEVLKENPKSVLGQFTEAKFLYADRDFEGASTRLRRVVEEQPSAVAHLLLGSSYLELGRTELARGELLQALQLDAQSALARTQLAALYLKTGERELAAQEARAGLERVPGNPQLTLILSEALVGQRKIDEARAALAEIELPEKPSEELRLQVARMQRITGAIEPARSALEGILADNPKSYAAMSELALADVQSREPDRAIEKLDRWIEESPDIWGLYELRGRILLGFQKEGKLLYGEQAEADLRKAAELAPQQVQPHMLLAAFYRETNRPDLAIEQYRAAKELAPRDPSVPMALGMLLEAQGKIEEAKEEYRAVLRIDQTQWIAKNNLAWLLVNVESPSAEDLDRALELAQSAKEAMPNDPSIADTLGWVMLKKNIPAAAITLFREAVDGYPQEHPLRGTARYHLARAYEANGQIERAIEELQKAIDETPAFAERAEAESLLGKLKSS